MEDLKENKTKKNWLYTFLISYIVSLIGFLISMFTVSNFRQIAGEKMFILMLIFQALFMSGWCYLYYSCAYKKPGRKLLFLHLILTPLSYLYLTLYKLNLLSFVPRIQNQNILFERVVLIVGFVISIFLYIFTLKLFRLNKEVKKRQIKVGKE